jgi:hypothetical protein
MKASLVRIKAIFSANFSYFVTATVVTAIIFGVILWAIKAFDWSLDNTTLNNVWLIVFISSIFLLPIYGYLSFHISRLSSGLLTTNMDTKVMKKSLFIYGGILWASLGWLIISFLLKDVSYLLYSTSAIVALSWYGIVKLLVRYGFTL